MKLIITENKRNRVIIKWLNSEYGDLTPYETEKFPNYILFMKDGEVIFGYDKKYRGIYVSYSHIWSFLKTFFELEKKEIQDLTKKWVEEHYNLRVTTTEEDFYNRMNGWENITN